MGNSEKHKKNLVEFWREAEDADHPAQARNSRVVGAYIKIPKHPARKIRQLQVAEPPKPDFSLARESAPPSKMEAKLPQASSPEHFRKLKRLPKLRAPVTRPVAASSVPLKAAKQINTARRGTRLR